jgi:hypothetical protein
MTYTTLLIVVFGSCVLGCSLDKLVKINNSGYCIGKIDYYSPGGKTDSNVHFQYEVNAKMFYQGYENGTHGWFVPAACSNCSRGNKFMVQYDSVNPSIARLLFNYPVIDSVDYKKDLILFKKTPPGY